MPRSKRFQIRHVHASGLYSFATLRRENASNAVAHVNFISRSEGGILCAPDAAPNTD
jgi:hypothetical protein